MANKFATLIVFLSSFYPLAWVYYATLAPDVVGLLILIMAHIFVGLLKWLLGKWESMAPERIEIRDVEARTEASVTYLFTYLFPFISFQGEFSLQYVVALVIFWLVLWEVYKSSNMLFINPTLTLMGYRFYAATTKSGKKIVILAKKDQTLFNIQEDCAEIKAYCVADLMYYMPSIDDRK